MTRLGPQTKSPRPEGSNWAYSVLIRLLLLAVAGAAGTLARYGLAHLVQESSGSQFPFGTLAVNALGCLVFGFIWSLAEDQNVLSQELRLFLLVGFLGAFTTFSTFAADSGLLLKDGAWLAATGNILLNNGVGLLCAFLGMGAGRWVR